MEESYDAWLDYPLGEKKERDTPTHYHVVEFLLQLANGPIRAAELSDPNPKPDFVNPDQPPPRVDSDDEFDQSQWRDDDTLSDWSDEEMAETPQDRLAKFERDKKVYGVGQTQADEDALMARFEENWPEDLLWVLITKENSDSENMMIILTSNKFRKISIILG